MYRKKYLWQKDYIETLEEQEEKTDERNRMLEAENIQLKRLDDKVILHFLFKMKGQEKAVDKQILGHRGQFQTSRNSVGEIVILHAGIVQFVVKEEPIEFYWLEFQDLPEPKEEVLEEEQKEKAE